MTRWVLALWTTLGCSPAPAPAPVGPSPERNRDLPLLGVCDVLDTHQLLGPDDLADDLDDLDHLAALGIQLARPHRPKGHAFAMNIVEHGWLRDWTLPDAVVQAAQARGVSLFVTLQPQARQAHEPRPGVMLPHVPPEQLAQWEDFVRAVVERYDGDGTDDMPGLRLPVYAWEVGNEPSCRPGDEVCARQYLEMVRTSWRAAHAADADAVVLVGGAAPLVRGRGGQRDPEVAAVYEYFFAHGGAEVTDAINFHTFVGRDRPALAEHVAAWQELAPGLPMWWTEMGPWFPQGAISADPQVQAAWVITQLRQAEALGIEHVLWCKATGEIDRNPVLYQALRDYVSGDQGGP